jgi:hypothetical protein
VVTDEKHRSGEPVAAGIRGRDIPDKEQQCWSHHRDAGILVLKISLAVECQNLLIFLKVSLSAAYLRHTFTLFILPLSPYF